MGTSDESAGPPQAVVTIAALAAGLVAQKLVSAGWKFIRGTDPAKDDSPSPEILDLRCRERGAPSRATAARKTPIVPVACRACARHRAPSETPRLECATCANSG